jgi:molecular chaperone GrpE
MSFIWTFCHLTETLEAMIGKKKKKVNMNMENERVNPEETQEKNEVNGAEENGIDEEAKSDGSILNEDQDLLDQCKKQNDELNDKFLRTLAEFDNFRKRTHKERVELIQSASSDMIVTLLPVLDDFERAVKAFESSTDLEALKEGLVLVHQKFRTILTQKGLEEMKSVGEEFNTDLHEAIANVQAEKDEDKNKVKDEVEKGYLLNGKVIRFAKVVVAN